MTYTTTAKAVRGGLLAAAALLAACAVPAGATGNGSVDWLYLTVARSDTRSYDLRATLLLCDPPRGGHARAAEACAELDAAGGDLRALPPRDSFCPMVHAPVTAHARGQWHGRPVDYTETFPNSCVMAARTGAVFALDG
ncbi:SSI family serine proteinase inhibitor [Streptomyces sp. NPDC051207]|uniref:SSI family serine proteinase inhibitor n=1 Tax=Streptomyces sp. NPDC051207 TaxID=3154641 RepID=UPI00341BC495